MPRNVNPGGVKKLSSGGSSTRFVKIYGPSTRTQAEVNAAMRKQDPASGLAGALTDILKQGPLQSMSVYNTRRGGGGSGRGNPHHDERGRFSS